MTTIDLNADIGEGCAFDVELLDIVSSCNIACGGHAGDAESMAEIAVLAAAKKVAVGAHPGYPDREEFGRRSRFCQGEELKKSLINQLDSLYKIAREAGATVRHLKPHGALYNDAVTDPELAALVVRATQNVCAGTAIVGPPHGALKLAALENDVPYIAEAFVDRAYMPSGNLVPRSEPNAVHGDINTITAQALTLATNASVTAENGDEIVIRADTLCIHGDTPNAGEIGRAVRDVLLASGIKIRAAL